MARFKYLGEPPRPGLITSYGPTLQLAIPTDKGAPLVLTKPEPGFVIGEDIGADITNQLSVLSLRTDPRFEEIV